MERKKTEKLVITFPTTTDALAMESACDPSYGRLIPVPSSIRAGCGLAWCAMPEQECALHRLMRDQHIAHEAMHIVLLY